MIIQKWEKVYSVPEDDNDPIEYSWIHKVGKNLDSLGTIRKIPCDEDGWIDCDKFMPDGHYTGSVQAIMEYVKETKRAKVMNCVRVVSADADLPHFQANFLYDRETKDSVWNFWQPLANLRNQDYDA